MSVAIIITFLNEEKTLEKLLRSLASQTIKPNEIILVDGGSTDNTLDVIQKFIKRNTLLKIHVYKKRGNRSIGRNFAIQKSSCEWIAITDAGCIPENDWLEQLLRIQKKSQTQVVAGYYRGLPRTNFEQAVVPYALVMPERVNEQDFLPATRSLLVNKKVWEDLQGFDELLSDNEDYAFAIKMKKQGLKMAFAREAVVGWMPRSTVSSFAKMIFRFARGDIRAGIVRPKVLFIFFRYFVLLLVLWHAFNKNSFYFLFLIGTLYLFWSVHKNIKYAKSGWYWLPVLQIVSDFSVLLGSISGLIKKLFNNVFLTTGR